MDKEINQKDYWYLGMDCFWFKKEDIPKKYTACRELKHKLRTVKYTYFRAGDDHVFCDKCKIYWTDASLID